ncbi:MAG: Ig-like domain-containing protein [Prevotella sp.]|nr:Ig-like domain-containing protein [Prevotella sp.]
MKKLQLFKTMLLLFALIVGSTNAWADASDYSAVYTSNVTLSTTGGTKATASTMSIGGKSYSAMKLGSSGNSGNFKVTFPVGTKYIHLHVAAWSGKNSNTLSFSGISNYTPNTAITLTANTGVSGNSTSYTFGTTTGNSEPNSANHYKVITLENALTSSTAVTITCSERCVIWGVNAEAEPTGVTIKNGDATITSLAMTEGDEDVTLSATVAPALAYQKVTWSSDNTSVATVTSAGVVHAVAAGTANIKATSSLSSIYGTCVVTVSSASSPTAIVSTAALAFGDVEVGQSKNMQFTITPANLESALSISCNNNKYTVSPISIAQDVTTAQTITVTAAPTALNDDMDGTITISGGGLEANRTVSLTATPYQVANVTLSATNGVIKENDEAKTSLISRVGSSATLTAVPNTGYLFDGWTAVGATPTSSSNAEEEFTFTSTTPTITANFIADPNVYATLEDNIPTPSANGQYSDPAIEITEDGYTWGFKGYAANGINALQIRKKTNTGESYVKLPTFPGYIQNITCTITAGSGTSKTGVGATPTSNVLYFQTGNTDASAEVVETSNNDNSNYRYIDISSKATKYNTGYITASGPVRIWRITVAYRPATVTSAGWGTYVAPCAVEFEEGDAYVVSAAGETTTLKSVTSVPVNTPVLLKGAGAKNISVTASAAAPESNLLKVSDGTITGDNEHIYVLSNKNNGVGFYLWDSTAAAIPAGKVYLDTTGATSKSLEFFSLDDSIYEESTDETTAIKNAAVEASANSSYNLAGQKVDVAYKGIVVVNGKKVVRK